MDNYVKLFLKQKKDNNKMITVRLTKNKSISKRRNDDGIFNLSSMYLRNFFDIIHHNGTRYYTRIIGEKEEYKEEVITKKFHEHLMCVKKERDEKK